MTIYWVLLTLPMLMIFLIKDKDANVFIWTLLFIIFAMFIGFRDEIGIDWPNYMRHLRKDTFRSIFDILQSTEPAYHGLNWLSGRTGGGIYLVNLVCGMIFLSGAIAFSRSQPAPMFVFFLMVPYVVFVIANGFVRQGVALGLVMWALAYHTRGENLGLVLFFAVAATLFHKSSMFIIPILLYTSHKFESIWFKAALIISIIPIAFVVTQSSYFEDKWDLYVTKSMVSTGGPIRVMMNAFPALIFLLTYRKFKKYWPKDRELYLMFSLIALSSTVFVWFASTAVDRLTFYIIPLQFMVFGRIFLFFNAPFDRTTAVLVIVIYYLVVWTVWANFASHVHGFIPYKSILL